MRPFEPVESGAGQRGGPSFCPFAKWFDRIVHFVPVIGQLVVASFVLSNESGCHEFAQPFVQHARRHVVAPSAKGTSSNRPASQLPQDAERPTSPEEVESCQQRVAANRRHSGQDPQGVLGLIRICTAPPKCSLSKHNGEGCRHFGIRNRRETAEVASHAASTRLPCPPYDSQTHPRTRPVPSGVVARMGGERHRLLELAFRRAPVASEARRVDALGGRDACPTRRRCR